MKRKLFSIALALLLLIPWTFASAATAPVSITSEDVRGKVGDTVAATLSIVVEPPKLGQTMDSLQFVLEYDSAALEYVGIQELSGDRINILGAQYTCSVTTKAGAVAFAASATGGGSGNGVLMHVRFKILSAASTMLVLKKVSYSFVTSSSGSQRAYTGGTLNLGRVTGETAPTTVAPASSSPYDSPQPSTPVDTAEPRYPVTEVSAMPGVTATPEEPGGESDTLAYIVFALFIIVAILICVVLTLMIVRRGRKAREQAFLEDADEIGYDDEDTYDDEDPYDDGGFDEEPYEEPPHKKQKTGTGKKSKPVSFEPEEEEEPIQVVRRKKKKQ